MHHEQGGSLPIGERRPAGSGPNLVGGRDVCRARATGRTEGRGEADGWAMATVPSGACWAVGEGDWCVSGARARVSRPKKKKGWSSLDEQ
jgi:hypothetical protein